MGNKKGSKKVNKFHTKAQKKFYESNKDITFMSKIPLWIRIQGEIGAEIAESKNRVYESTEKNINTNNLKGGIENG